MPRLADRTNSILDLMVCDSETVEVEQGEGIGYDLSVVDFEDACHTLAIREQDCGVMAFVPTKAGQFSGDFVVEWQRHRWYGVGSVQHVFLPNELQLCCCIGASFSVSFNKRKAHRGSSVLWNGAQVTSVGHAHRAHARQGQGHAGQRRQPVKAKGMVDIKQVQRLAGQLSWASGLFPWLKCFNIMLWSAITAHVTEQYYQKWTKKKRLGQLFFVVRIWHAQAWERLLDSGLIATPEPRTEYTKMDSRQNTVSDDAQCLAHRCFTTTGSAPSSLSRACQWCGSRATGRHRISTCSVQRAATQPGNPSGNYTQRYWRSIRGCPVSVANLYVLPQNPSHEGARSGDRFTPSSVPTSSHYQSAWPGALNFDCDALSRLSEGAQLPAILGNVWRDLGMACYVAHRPSEAVPVHVGRAPPARG